MMQPRVGIARRFTEQGRLHAELANPGQLNECLVLESGLSNATTNSVYRIMRPYRYCPAGSPEIL